MLESTRPTRSGSRTRTAAGARTSRQAPVSTATGDLQDRIAQRAYEIYERRGHADGHELDDWLEAERQVREEKP
jgi:hypothetical protein